MTGLKLRDDAYWIPTDDGIRILSNSGEVVLTGSSIFQWIDRLAPHLDGRYTLAELTVAMPPERRAMAERIIAALQARGVVTETDDGAPAGRLLTDAERRLRAYRDSALVLVGSGRMLEHTVEAALCSGSRRLRVVVTGECPTDEAALARHERQATQRDPDCVVTRVRADLATVELPDLVSQADLVGYACDMPTVGSARALDLACAKAAVPFAAAILAADEAWLGPFGPAIQLQCGWTSAWRRLLAGSDPDARLTGPASGDALAGPGPTVAANQFVRETMQLLCGVANPGPDRMISVDLQSLRTQRHRFQPHPFSTAASPPDQASLPAKIDRLRTGERIAAQAFSERVTASLQRRVGVLGEVSERDFEQIPLAVTQVQVSDPVGLVGPGAPLAVATGAGLSLADARRAAVLRGLATYGSLMVDPRRLHTRSGAADPRTGDPDDDLAALRAGGWTGFVWGYGLADGVLHELPATTVFPALRLPASGLPDSRLSASRGARSGYQPPVGVAAGYDWDEAVGRGLIGQCRRLTLTEVFGHRRAFTPIDVSAAELDAVGSRYRALAQIIGERLDVYDLSGSLRVPTVALCLDRATLAYACGFTFADALRDGLAELLLSYQSRASGQADYAPAQVRPLPRRRRSTGAGCPTWSTDQATVVARLGEQGWATTAVPLDHDPVVGDVMPNLVHVVLTRG